MPGGRGRAAHAVNGGTNAGDIRHDHLDSPPGQSRELNSVRKEQGKKVLPRMHTDLHGYSGEFWRRFLNSTRRVGPGGKPRMNICANLCVSVANRLPFARLARRPGQSKVHLLVQAFAPGHSLTEIASVRAQ